MHCGHSRKPLYSSNVALVSTTKTKNTSFNGSNGNDNNNESIINVQRKWNNINKKNINYGNINNDKVTTVNNSNIEFASKVWNRVTSPNLKKNSNYT